MIIRSINPATEKINHSFTALSYKKSEEIAKKVNGSFPNWKNLSIKERCDYMRRLASALRAKKDEYAKLITLEMGKPISQATAEVEKCAWTAEFFAEKSEDWLKDEPVQIDGKHAVVSFEPIGEILAIMPWNFPFWQALRCAIPAMVAGNVVLLRHSNVVPMCALAIEEAFKLAGFPKDTFRTILADHATVDKLIQSEYVAGVSVTGSVETGKAVAKLAGESLKKTVLELGGSDPFIVLDDAHIEFACENAVDARLISNGQSCICAKRMIVTKKNAAAFTEHFTKLMSAAKVGDPFDKNIMVGPVVSKRQLLKLKEQVDDARKKGAKIECGGKAIDKLGFFFEPTVISGVKKNMLVYNEEVFGPIAAVIVAEDEEDAIRIANGSRFGLGASIWTSDIQKGEKLAKRIESGMIFVNEITKSDPRLPFGGIKQSGIGRELSRYGLLEFTNIKPIVAPYDKN
jgi:acyl-CoA reductase-like NAD-dependent aldehyde dehydrogenase